MSRNIRSALPVPCYCTLYTLNPNHVFEFIRIATASEKNVDHILFLSKSTDQAYKEAQEPRQLVALTATTDGPIGTVIAASISPPGLWARRVTTKLSILIKLLIN